MATGALRALVTLGQETENRGCLSTHIRLFIQPWDWLPTPFSLNKIMPCICDYLPGDSNLIKLTVETAHHTYFSNLKIQKKLGTDFFKATSPILVVFDNNGILGSKNLEGIF